MRLLFIHFPRAWDDDTDVYAELGRNLLRHGVYGIANDDGSISPSLIRLPGYPLLLGFAQILFHSYWVKAVLLLQAAAEMCGCFLLAAFAKRKIGERAALIAFALAALCPFTAAYAATALTESLSIFAVTLAVYAFGLLEAERAQALLLMAGAAMLAILLRPDGVLLLFAEVGGLLFYLKRYRVRDAAVVAMLAVLPLLPWAARNWSTFHVVQPLAPRHVNDPGEPVNLGVYRWIRTWSVDLSNTGQVYWQIGQNPINPAVIPERAFDSAQQKERTLKLIADYNATDALAPQMNASLDARFAAIAAERVHDHPLRYTVFLPAWRVVDMALRPRTEALGLDVFWWKFSDHPAETVLDIALALVNLVYFAGAVFAFVRGRAGSRGPRAPLAVFCGGYLLMRCMLLGTMENSEPRYTLEMFPILIVCAAATYAAWMSRGERSGPARLEGS